MKEGEKRTNTKKTTKKNTEKIRQTKRFKGSSRRNEI